METMPPNYGHCDRCGKIHHQAVCEHCLDLIDPKLGWADGVVIPNIDQEKLRAAESLARTNSLGRAIFTESDFHTAVSFEQIARELAILWDEDKDSFLNESKRALKLR